MGPAVLERDWLQLQEAVGRAEAGDTAAAQYVWIHLQEVTSKCTGWQWVIHGDTREYRRGVVSWLCRTGRFSKALKFAMCGRGDVVRAEVGGERVAVSPRGCGCRFCPRCSRRSGHRFLKRIGVQLESRGHGEIVHFVLTQPVAVNEGVAGARARWNKAWSKWYRALRKAGMRSALLTQHVKPRETWGWHYHGHCIVEWEDGIDGTAGAAALEVAWQRACKEEHGREKSLFCRVVTGQGEALPVGSVGGQGDFWQEPEGAVARVLQYAVRDVVQGCEEWVVRLKTAAEIAEFAEVISDAKLHRLFGEWRRPLPKGDDECLGTAELKLTTGAKVVTGKESVVWAKVGGIEELVSKARVGEARSLELLRGLSLAASNHGKVASRLRTLVRSVSLQRRAG